MISISDASGVPSLHPANIGNISIIIANKGATFYAVTRGVCRLCSILMSASESVTTVSSMMHGEYGIEDVCLSTLSLVGPNGIQGKIPMTLTEDEIEKMKKSADALKDVIAQIEL